MKKKLSALVLGTILVGSLLAGCAAKDETPKTPDSGSNGEATTGLTTEDITLKVWESTGGPDKWIEQAGAKFTEKYPNIKVEFVNVELGDTATQIGLDGPAGVGPDLFAAPHDKLGELVTAGHVLPTENTTTLQESVLGATVTALTYEGTMYGYPVSAETYGLFYNKALVSEENVPTTWDEVVSFAETFNTQNPGKYGFMMNPGDAYYTIIFTTADDNRLFGATGTDRDNSNINTEASISGMKTFQELRKVLDIPAADLTTSIVDAAFSSGNAALHITGLWNVATFEAAGVEFGVTQLPSLPGNDTPVASFSGTRAMFVSAYSEYPAEAAAFGQFLISEEMQQLRFELTGALPSITTTVDSPYIPGFLKQLDYAFPMPSIPEMAKYWEAMNSASANIWNGSDIKTELDTVDAVLKPAQ